MANLAESAVTLVDSWTDGGISSKRHVEAIYDLVLSGQGGTTNKILASALGLTKVERCGNAVKNDNTVIYTAVPSYDGTYIALGIGTETPADVTATVRIFVAGFR